VLFALLSRGRRRAPCRRSGLRNVAALSVTSENGGRRWAVGRWTVVQRHRRAQAVGPSQRSPRRRQRALRVAYQKTAASSVSSQRSPCRRRMEVRFRRCGAAVGRWFGSWTVLSKGQRSGLQQANGDASSRMETAASARGGRGRSCPDPEDKS
jgi:hypothetical protein